MCSQEGPTTQLLLSVTCTALRWDTQWLGHLLEFQLFKCIETHKCKIFSFALQVLFVLNQTEVVRCLNNKLRRQLVLFFRGSLLMFPEIKLREIEIQG